MAVLLLSTQLVRLQANAPPPLCASMTSPLPVDPLVKVNPSKAAPLVRYTQRKLPLAAARLELPSMLVKPGPLTLWTVTGLSITTRLVAVADTARAPTL